ncbi:MAG: ATP-binding protein [Armatimonadota bacterium]
MPASVQSDSPADLALAGAAAETMKPRGTSLRLKLTVTVAVLQLVIFATLAGLTESFIRRQSETRLRVQARGHLEALTAMCEKVAWRDAEAMSAYMERMVGAGGIAFAAVTDAENRVVAHSDPASIGGLYTSPDTQNLEAATDGIYRASREIEAAESSWRHLRVGLATARLLAPVAAARQRALVVAAALLLLSVGVTWLAVGRVLGPLAQLEREARALGRGDMDARVEVHSHDELEHLADTFNSMAAQLQDMHTNLEQRIATRTRELAQAYDELLAANRALEHSEQRYRSLVERANDAIYVVDAEGQILSANRQTHRMLGYDWRTNELVGHNHLEWVLSEDEAIARSAIETVIRDGAVSQVDLRFRCGDQQTRQMRINAVSLAENGRVVGAQVIARDMTERARLDAELASAAKLRALGELAAGIAHEINSPMCAVTAFSEMVRRQAEELGVPQGMLDDLDTIREQSERVVRITERVLTFATPREPSVGALDVNEALVSGMALARYGREAAGVRIRFDLARGLPLVSADRDGLAEVFLNLAVNAQQAMPDGGTLKVATRREHGFVRIDFTDTGPGISRENIERVFEPGFSTKDEDGVVKGLGLGLFLSERIIASLNGTMSVTSEEGKGATFTVRLPALGAPPG